MRILFGGVSTFIALMLAVLWAFMKDLRVESSRPVAIAAVSFAVIAVALFVWSYRSGDRNQY